MSSDLRVGLDGKLHSNVDRKAVLDDAAKLTTGDRAETYGDATTNMHVFAGFMAVYRANRHPKNPTPGHDAAIIMALAKIARITVGANVHRDNYVDAAAYIAMAYEAAKKETVLP